MISRNKRIISIMIVMVLLGVGNAFAQIEINAYTGWVPASTTQYSYNGYRLRIGDSQNFGGGLGLATPIGLIEFNYMGFSSTVSQDGGIEIPGTRLPQAINVNYYQLGILKTLMEHEKFIPYGLFSLGVSNFNPQKEDINSAKFSISLGLGMRYFFTDAIGIRLQARMLMPLFFGGVGIGCGIGTGGANCGGGATFGVEILQADFSGGVVLRINNQ